MDQLSKELDKVTKSNLTEKQSVRTTFKISGACSQAIDWLVKTNNLKPKELFDQMCANEKLVDLAVKFSGKNNTSTPIMQIRKTFVISTHVKRLLNKLSKENELSRDLIFENLILLFRILVEKYDKEEKQKEEKAQIIISDFCTKTNAIEKQLNELLDDDSPILERFSLIMVVVMNLENAIESKLSNDIPIHPDDMSQS